MQNLVRSHQFHNSVTNLRKLICDNPILDLVNLNASVKVGHIPSTRPKDTERKRNSDVNGPGFTSRNAKIPAIPWRVVFLKRF